MKVVTLKDIPNAPMEGAEPIAGYTGPVSRSRQTISFSLESPPTITAAIVATEHEQRQINVGDVVHIKAGERHWHGAKADTTMGHITITLVGSQATHG